MQAEETKMILRYFGGIEAQLDDVNIELAELRDRYNPILISCRVDDIALDSGAGLLLDSPPMAGGDLVYFAVECGHTSKPLFF